MVRGKKGLKTPEDFDLQQRGIIFNPAELTTQSMAHCQTYNPVKGEWPYHRNRRPHQSEVQPGNMIRVLPHRVEGFPARDILSLIGVVPN